MQNQRDLNQLEGVEWLVAARNEIQTLMWKLEERWDELRPGRNRRLAAEAAFSLWRAAFLLAKKEELLQEEEDSKTGRAGSDAYKFISRIVRTNSIQFNDEMARAHFTAPYYVDNAIYRVSQMRRVPPEQAGLSVRTLRVGWNESFLVVKHFVEKGTIPGT